MNESNVANTAVITLSSILWEGLVMPQELKNAPVAFSQVVSHVMRGYAPNYFDDVFLITLTMYSTIVGPRTD